MANNTATRKSTARARVTTAAQKAAAKKSAPKTTTRTKGSTTATATRKPRQSKPEVVEASITAQHITDPQPAVFGKFTREGKFDSNYDGPKGDGGVCFSTADGKKPLKDAAIRQVYISQEAVAEAEAAGADTSKCTILLVWEA